MTMSETTTTTTGTSAAQLITPLEKSYRNGIKRSLSESSADEYQRSCKENNSSGYNSKMWQNELLVNASSTLPQPQRKKDVLDPAERDNKYRRISNFIDIAIRVAIVISFIKLELTVPFKRKIHLEELWLYKNPRMPDIVAPLTLIVAVIFGPFCTTLLRLLISKDRRDFRAASWAWTLALCLNGVITSLLKITVGRPRPDFYYRCFPDGKMVFNNLNATTDNTIDIYNCTGNIRDINEGFKSFPSGHSSFAFASFAFITFYVGAKLHAFDSRGRGQTWRLCCVLTPLILAGLIAISRTCDYHHHWQDIVVGGFIGFFTSYWAYRQYYPSVFSINCQRSYNRYNSFHSLRKTKSFNKLYTDSVDAASDTSDDFDVGTKIERHPLIISEKRSHKKI
ncbi:phospholipid phosphatase 5 isoform X2 [Teleopsis dalmanni]|nr:phospholipid phosphatase 5 isoform X2 [Teleopsis dalmanni]